MTLSNEQRAHDYALTVLLSIRDAKISENQENDTEHIPIDVFEIYVDTYESALQKLNTLFPDSDLH